MKYIKQTWQINNTVIAMEIPAFEPDEFIADEHWDSLSPSTRREIYSAAYRYWRDHRAQSTAKTAFLKNDDIKDIPQRFEFFKPSERGGAGKCNPTAKDIEQGKAWMMTVKAASDKGYSAANITKALLTKLSVEVLPHSWTAEGDKEPLLTLKETDETMLAHLARWIRLGKHKKNSPDFDLDELDLGE